MNRDEVQGLQALAMAQGGSLSINPNTGLPEAFSLKGAFKKFLPTIVGGALAATGFGAPAAALAGGLAGVATSKKNFFEGFAMGALGGFGGAGLAQAAQLGSAAAPGLAGADAAKVGADAAGAGINEAAKSGTSGLNLSGAGAGPSIPGGATMPSLSSVAPVAPPGTPPIIPGGIAPASPAIPTGMPPAPASGGLNLSGATGGAGRSITDASNIAGRAVGAGAGPVAPGGAMMPSMSPTPAPSTGLRGIGGKFNDLAEGLTDKIIPTGLQETVRNPTLGKAGIASLMSASSRTEAPKMKKGPLFRQYDFDPITREFTAREPSDTWQDPYAPGAAAGGAINNIAAQNNYLANMSRGGATDTDINSYSGEPRYAQGGMPPDMGGRFLKGPGDGVSDSIPAEIAAEGGTIPAKLAAGEFVVPARIVAELGNGSSDAGAKELYRMLDRIEARMKKSKRGKDSGARKELVA
jgi:hypothetical protein